jgi:inosine-uridine nucleoside N-ribohydrolase
MLLDRRRSSLHPWSYALLEERVVHRKIILDVDTGVDDAVALLIALCSADIEVLGISTVNGNCSLAVCTENTLRVLDWMRSDIPVYAGMGRPLLGVPTDGEGGCFDLPPARSGTQPEHAVDWLVRTLMDSDGDITLVALAPLTNIATAMRREPRILPRLRELVVMGGGHTVSNATPSAEFNIWIDPEAARIVLNCGRPIWLVTLDATDKARSSQEDVARLAQCGTRAGELAAHLLDTWITPGNADPIYDALAMCALIDPQVIRTRLVHLDVELRGELTRGRTVCDFREERPYRRRWGAPNVHVAYDADGALFTRMLHGILGGHRQDFVPGLDAE